MRRLGRSRSRSSAERAAEAAQAVRENPYVQRLAADDHLRETIRDAFTAAHSAYSRAAKSKRPARSVVDDKRVQQDLRDAADALRTAAEALREPTAAPASDPSSGGGLGKPVVVVFVGAIAAICLSEDLRHRLLDRLFGAEEEFEYPSTTSPAAVRNGNGPGAVASSSAEAPS